MKKHAAAAPLALRAREGDLRARVEGRAMEHARYVAPGLAVLYALLAIGHGRDGVLGQGDVWVMRLLAGSTSVLLAVTHLVLRRWSVPARVANPIGFVIGLVVLTNATVHIALDGRLIQSTNFMLIALAAGAFLLSWLWWGLLMAVTAGLWLALAVPHGPSADALHFASMMAMAIAFSAMLHGARLHSVRREERLRRHLERFVSAGASAAAIDAADSGAGFHSRRRYLTVWFSDVRGFTRFAETVDPVEVVAVLNRLLAVQTEAIRRHDGDVDKFVGDAVVAVFAGPGAAERAVRAAIEAVDAVTALKLSPLHIGVGINAGDVVVGPVGDDTRLDHTVIGDAVNVGARLCHAAQAGEILVSESVAAQAAEVLAGLDSSDSAPLVVRGRSEPVAVVAVRPRDSEPVDVSRPRWRAPRQRRSRPSVVGLDRTARSRRSRSTSRDGKRT